MIDPNAIESGDVLELGVPTANADGEEEFPEGEQFEVDDVDVEDVGLTETFAITLSGKYAIMGTTADSIVTMTEIEGDGEWRVDFTRTEKVGSFDE